MLIYYLKGETFEKHFGTKSKTKKALLVRHCCLLYSNQTPFWQEEKYPIRFLHYTNPIKSQTNKKLNIGLRLWLRLLFPPRLKSNTTNGTPLVSVLLKVDSIQFLHMLCNGNASFLVHYIAKITSHPAILRLTAFQKIHSSTDQCNETPTFMTKKDCTF